MTRLKCSSKFRVFEPKEENRTVCPFVLIVASGAHPHPVPLPTKTPPKIRDKVMKILGTLAEDLPDMTPRRFIRHPIVRSFLATKFPLLICPTLADWHVSLSNRSHIKSYIKLAIEGNFPFGTGWNGQHFTFYKLTRIVSLRPGVLHMKAQQDASLPPEKRYIRRIIAIPTESLLAHDEDEEPTDTKDQMTRIIICMAAEASRRLLSAGQYLQSDIAFRRIVGFLEFELACMDRDANTSMFVLSQSLVSFNFLSTGLIFCRVYINRQTAAAHQRVFEEIEAIVKEDTGKSLQWRHLHAASTEGSEGYSNLLLSWTADQHRGQAKGMALRPCGIIFDPRKRTWTTLTETCIYHAP